MIETSKLDGGSKGENYGLFNEKIFEIGNWPTEENSMLCGMKCKTSNSTALERFTTVRNFFYSF